MSASQPAISPDTLPPTRRPRQSWLRHGLLRRPSVLPGFSLSLGYAVVYLSLIVLIPLSAVVFKTAGMGPAEFWRVVSSPSVVHALALSFGASLVAAAVNAVMGLILAWVLVRYRFPGRRVVDALVDLPFALPTAVAGITLTTLYARNGWLGSWIEGVLGVKVAFTQLGIVVALVFIGIPFVVRTVQPVIEDLSKELEEAAASLGASRFQTLRRVILPELWPAMVTGFALAFARAIGEYGSVVFIAGNQPMKTQIAPLKIMSYLEEFNYQAATAVAVVMLVVSFAMLLLINWLQGRRPG